MVDDGSRDYTGEILDNYAKKDRRIKVIHKENGGVSSARNKGIEAAEGDYIGFIDGDDLIAVSYTHLYRLVCKDADRMWQYRI